MHATRFHMTHTVGLGVTNQGTSFGKWVRDHRSNQNILIYNSYESYECNFFKLKNIYF